jgi:[ribosomal protein S5]-alanine N-acetyltransferase
MTTELVGTKCVVRSFVASDVDSIASVANDRGIWLQLRDLFPHPYRRSDAQTYIDRVVRDDPPRSLAISVGGTAVGVVGLQLMNDVNRKSAEIGYWLGTEYWGRGIASEALGLVTAWAFPAHGLMRIFAQPFARNLPSRRVLEKAGYELEGTMRCNAVKDGRILDQCLYARVDAETLRSQTLIG